MLKESGRFIRDAATWVGGYERRMEVGKNGSHSVESGSHRVLYCEVGTTERGERSKTRQGTRIGLVSWAHTGWSRNFLDADQIKVAYPLPR